MRHCGTPGSCQNVTEFESGLSCTQVRENGTPGQTLNVSFIDSGIEVRFPMASKENLMSNKQI